MRKKADANKGKQRFEQSMTRSNLAYTTKEFSAPIKNTKNNQPVVPANTRFFDEDHPSGVAKTTGTPITRANERNTRAKRRS